MSVVTREESFTSEIRYNVEECCWEVSVCLATPTTETQRPQYTSTNTTSNDTQDIHNNYTSTV